MNIRRVPDHRIKPHELSFVIQDFGKLEHPFQRVRKVDVACLRYVAPQVHNGGFLQLGLEAVDVQAQLALVVGRASLLVVLDAFAVFLEPCGKPALFVGFISLLQKVENHAIVLHGVLAQERIAHLDVDVDIRQRFEAFEVAFFGVVGVLQQFNPQAQTADVYAVGVQVYAKEAILDDVLLFFEQGFLNALAFFVAGLVFKGFVVFVHNGELVVVHFQSIVGALDALALGVAKNVQVRFDGEHAVQRRNQEMPGTDGDVGHAHAIHNLVRVLHVVDFVGHVFKVLTIPALDVVEFLHHRSFEHVFRHVVGDKARGVKAAVLVAVNLFENESQHRRVDERLVGVGHAALGIASKVVGIEELEDVIQIRERAFCAFAAFVLENGLVKNFDLGVGDSADFEAGFVFGGLEERAVQIRHVRVFF